MKTLILYHTKTGHTLEAARAVEEGLASAGCSAKTMSCSEFTKEDLKNTELLIIGSPTWMSGISTPVKRILKELEENSLKDIVCGCFAIHGGSGGEKVIKDAENLVRKKGCSNFTAGPVARAGAFASLVKGPPVKKEDLDRFRNFGVEIGSVNPD